MSARSIVILAMLMTLAGVVPASAADTAPASPAEHLAAASAYEAEANDARQKAALHEQAASRHRNAPRMQKGTGVSAAALARHCQTLADAYGRAASEADSLARLHRDAARATE